ncbi:hypothetical protein WQQ_34280 [Hydrocarboniphaga effusa AP103]|uniref:Uncharacterized protein n=1 Tax=Hydrocarboniphaga effusa AP103 TaxID=1172194 RepID=I8I209_9GAMM|nr:hypothetical protein WQQ_34280 [Hydrocarboniphaga effusa AP103]
MAGASLYCAPTRCRQLSGIARTHADRVRWPPSRGCPCR